MTPRLKLEPGAAALIAGLNQNGHAAYAVGGCVRDSLLGLLPHDWDLCTSALPEQVISIFGEQQCIPTGLKHGTVTVKHGGRLYEITTFRTEGAYSDGRHPDAVAFVPDVRADLARRDFTINAMAYNSAEGLIDPFGGEADLAAHLVRAVGQPEKRFEEDALRIMRLYRFAARFGFAIDPATAAAARRLAARLSLVSAERIQDELCRLLCAPKPGPELESEVFAVVLPELAALGPGAISRQAALVDAVPPDLPVRLAALLLPLGAAGARGALRRLRCSNALINDVTLLLAESGLKAEAEPGARRFEARRLTGRLGTQQLRRLVALCAALRPAEAELYEALMREAEKQTAQGFCCTISQLAVNGADLIAAGAAPGPGLRRTLAELLEAVITEKLPNERAALLEYAARSL